MRTVELEAEASALSGLGERVVTTAIRLLRLAGLSALLGLLAGAGARVHAELPQPTETATAVSAPAPAADAATAQAQPEPVYEVLPGELMPSQPSIMVVAKSSIPPAADLQAAAAEAKGKKGKKKKEKAPKLTPVHIVQGTLTVDGWTGKARLNYDIADLKYIYVWVPGIGTIVASNQKFPLGTEQKGAFSGNTLTLEAKGHQLQISSDKTLLKEKKPLSAWVYVDTAYKTSSTFPQMGYGSTKDAPYAWPGAKESPVEKGGVMAPPPLPAGMRPMIAKPTCLPAGAASTTGSRPTATACPAAPARSGTPPSSPAAAPPVPLPGYSSGTTTALAAPAPPALPAK